MYLFTGGKKKRLLSHAYFYFDTRHIIHRSHSNLFHYSSDDRNKASKIKTRFHR